MTKTVLVRDRAGRVCSLAELAPGQILAEISPEALDKIASRLGATVTRKASRPARRRGSSRAACIAESNAAKVNPGLALSILADDEYRHLSGPALAKMADIVAGDGQPSESDAIADFHALIRETNPGGFQ